MSDIKNPVITGESGQLVLIKKDYILPEEGELLPQKFLELLKDREYIIGITDGKKLNAYLNVRNRERLEALTSIINNGVIELYKIDGSIEYEELKKT